MEVDTLTKKLDTPLDELVGRGRRSSSGPRGRSDAGPMRKGTLSSTSGRQRQVAAPYSARQRPLARRATGVERGGRPPAGSGRAPSELRGIGRPIVHAESAADDPLSGGDCIKVGGNTVPRNLAGLIVNQVGAVALNDYTAPIVSVGASSVNQAVKGLAIARRSLEPSRQDFYFMPSFVRLESEDLNAIHIDIERTRPRSIAQMDGMELRAAGATDVKGLAGAVAKNARDSANSFIVAVGANSVNQAVKAIAIARTYLSEENMDLRCRASIEDIDEGELAGKSSVTIVVEPIAT